MNEKLYRFMNGRYGLDQFSKFLVFTGIIIVLISNFIGGIFLNTIGLAAFVYAYFRMFSRNHPKRYRENQKYLSYLNKFKNFFKKQNNHMNQRKTHHIYSCPNCKQKIRIPKGKGKIEIACPKCHTRFVKRS
jgi:DNA-directed RNA polymerase subunit RPC12/RpoP